MPAYQKNRSWSSTFSESIQSCLCWFLISVSKHSRTNYWIEPIHKSILTDLVEELSRLGIPNLTKQKTQEQFDNTALSNLLVEQTSTREKTRLLSLTPSYSLPQSVAWLMAALIPALGLHVPSNELQVALNYRLGIPLSTLWFRKEMSIL